MTATFDPSLSSPLDRVRFKIGDTDTNKPVVQNETITSLLAETGATVASVSASLARYVLTIYQQRATYDVDGQGERWSDVAKAYVDTVNDLVAAAAAEERANANEDAITAGQLLGGGIMVGGTKTSENIAKSEDPERAANFSPRYR